MKNHTESKAGRLIPDLIKFQTIDPEPCSMFNLKVYDTINCLNKNLITPFV